MSHLRHQFNDIISIDNFVHFRLFIIVGLAFRKLTCGRIRHLILTNNIVVNDKNVAV